ncbi:MAG TPA: hypothetical protein VMR14_21705 [Streptosporangiaceae bacterium]|jgi:hypothetical protein|nr:hypothetical protein [Streptosporangiaceae bacterium]
MRSALQNAISRRDDRLARTRRLSVGIATGATLASVGLAAVLGAAIPGHASTTRTTPGNSGSPADGSSGTKPTSQRTTGPSRTGLTPPTRHPGQPQPSSGSSGPPVVHSGGS